MQVETVRSISVTRSPNISFVYTVILDMHLHGIDKDHVHAMKSKDRGGLTPLILKQVLVGCEWPVSLSGRFIPEEITPVPVQ